jgi:hypothetical protein
MKKLLLLLTLLVLPGCPWQNTQPEPMAEVWPVYRIPRPPVLDLPDVKPGENKDMDKMIDSVYKLTQYVDVMLSVMETHNTAANAHNAKVSQTLGLSVESGTVEPASIEPGVQ